MIQVLQVDITGTPQDWISHETAAGLLCSGDISWNAGPVVATLRGGRSQRTGLQSTLDIPAILATRGQSRKNLLEVVPPLTKTNTKLFERDRRLCAYCGEVFTRQLLTREHVLPTSRGGKDVWTNVVTACAPCNSRKAARTPEEARMPLLYLPYAPNLFEDFLLQQGGRRILADQMEFLMRRVPLHSRLRAA